MKSVHQLWGVFAVCLAGIISSPGQAIIEGKVSLPKAPARPASRPRYPAQATPPGPAEPAMAVVYLEGVSTNFAAADTRIEIGQRRLQFVPGLLPIQKGTRVSFPNHDDLYHNVFSYSKAKRFDLGRYQKHEKPAEQIFDQPGVVKLYCEIHEHMRATILVLDTPHFVKTDTNGNYRLEGLPAGKFSLKAWLDEKDIRERVVELKSDSHLRLDFAPP